MNKVIKYIIVVLLLIFSVSMSVASFVMVTEAEAYGPMMLILFVLITMINIGEIVRIRKQKKYIFLPMIGMYLVAIMTALLFEFIKEAVCGDSDALEAAIFIGICETITILSMYGLNKGMTMKPTTQSIDSNNTLQWQFNSFNAEWSWDAVCDEYRNILLDKMSDEERNNIDDVEVFFEQYLDQHPEMNDQIYIYGCNEFAYMFLWIVRRGGLDENEFIEILGDEMTEHVKNIAECKENPTEFIYYHMDGKVCRNDFLPIYGAFLDNYYERSYMNFFTKNVVVRDVSYGKDYDEIVLKSLEGLDGPVYCREFDYNKYYIFEERLNQRFEDFRRNSANIMEDMESYKEDFYSHALDKHMEVKLQTLFVFDYEKEQFLLYADKCLAEIDNMPEKLLLEICKILKGLEDAWILEEDKLTPELFKKKTSSGEVQIFKPYSKELAYNLCFETEFEQEHGIHVTIRGGHVIEAGYRMDAESPWRDRWM